MASSKYNAVELDEVSLTLLQNLAVADILVGILRGIPVLVSGTYLRIWCPRLRYVLTYLVSSSQVRTYVILSIQCVCVRYVSRKIVRI